MKKWSRYDNLFWGNINIVKSEKPCLEFCWIIKSQIFTFTSEPMWTLSTSKELWLLANYKIKDQNFVSGRY